MLENETMVENEELDTGAADTPEESGIEEEQDESEESLDSLKDEEAAPTDQPKEQQATEPGWIKQRVSKAVQKAVAETEARMQAMFEQQMAPIRAKMMEDEAQELVRSRKVTDIETARELVRLRQGQPVQTEQPQPAQPRNERGQFTAKSDDSGMNEVMLDMLAHQADTIKEKTGIDVVEVFSNDREIKQKVMSGKMDFYDVAEMMKQQKTKKPPAPMRSPNGASGQTHNAITTMSDEQFARMEKRISEGARYSLK